MARTSCSSFALLVAFVSCLAGTAAHAGPLGSTHPTDGSVTVTSGGDVLYTQLDDPSGSGFTDQSFEAPYAAYDGTGADDFDVTGFAWDITEIITPGSQTVAGSNPFFVSHAFYADAGGIPGAVLSGCDFPANTDFTSDGSGDLATRVDCAPPSGVNWLSQTVRQDFNPLGQHFWATRNTAVKHVAVWKNPGNGFGTGCLDWSAANATCGQTGEDMLFELRGNDFPCFPPAECTPPSCGDPPLPPCVPAVDSFGILALILALGFGSAYLVRRG